MATSPLEFDPIVIPKVRGRTILDVGCGYGKWGFLIKKYFWLTADGDATSSPFVFGSDKFLPGLLGVQCHQLYDGLVGADAAAMPFRGGSFDTVAAIEVIEHLPKEQGVLFLQEAERVARRCVIISTPCLRDDRGGLKGLYGFNAWEAHLSRWRTKELERMGFRCYGVGLRFGPPRLRLLLSPFAYRIPALAAHIIAVKLL